MKNILTVALFLAGLVNVFPVIGVFSADVLAGLYDIPKPQGDLLILMRHRAVLFGIIGSLILLSVYKRRLRATAIIIALVSMLSFIALTLLQGEYGAKLHRVMLIDVAATALLLIAMVLQAVNTNRP